VLEYTNRTRSNQVKEAIKKFKAISSTEKRLRKWKIKKLDGLAYDPTIDYKNNIGTMNQKCKFCNAFKWIGKTPGMCCNIGKTKLDTLQPQPHAVCFLA